MADLATEVMIIEQLICNEEYYKSVLPFMKQEWFSEVACQYLLGAITAHSGQYNSAPTIESLYIGLGNEKLPEQQYDVIAEILGSLSDKCQDPKWMFDSTEKYCKQRAIHLALSKSIAIQTGEDTKTKVGAIPEILETALAVDFSSDTGLSYFDDSEAYYKRYYELSRIKYAFDIAPLNEATNGGVARQTLNVVLAGIGTGKTTWLLCDCVKKTLAGHNCLYISLEVGADIVRERADVIMLDTIFGTVEKMDSKEYVSKLNVIKEACGGTLFIKEFPDGASSTADYKHLIRDIWLKYKIKFDFIYIDYITNAASEQLEVSAKSNSNLYFGIVAQEFRAFAKREDLVVWTAAQLTRSKQTSEDANLADIGLAITVSAIADFMIFLAAPEQLLDQNLCVAKLLKNRYGHSKPKFLIGANQEKQIYYERTDSNQAPPMKPTQQATTLPSKPSSQASIPGTTDGSDLNKLKNWKF